MTKTLTEQWRNGTLEESMYYVKLPDNDVQIVNLYQLKQLALVNDANEIEVLAAVPGYKEYNELLRHSELSRNLVYEVLVNQKEYNELLDKAKEYKLLEKRLDIATKALKRYEDKQNWDIGGVAFIKYNKGFTIARKALKEMERVPNEIMIQAYLSTFSKERE